MVCSIYHCGKMDLSSSFEETNDRVALAVFMLSLKISVAQTKFICNGGSISRDLTITPSVDIYKVNSVKSFTLTYASPGIHGIRKIIWTSIHALSDVLYRKLNVATLSHQKEFGCFLFYFFTISTLSNNDVGHGLIPIDYQGCPSLAFSQNFANCLSKNANSLFANLPWMKSISKRFRLL